ncbi:Hypothetical protein HVR_LOCUS119 [uncultured virus]|nr:Hypothetical protein HVR_LOCUS119 [uncultured virus]
MWKNWFPSRYIVPCANISYTIHDKLENVGPTVQVNEILSPEVVDKTIKECTDPKLPVAVKSAQTLIRNSMNCDCQFSNPEFMKKIGGIFIHNATEGLIMIKGSESDNEHIISIRI